MDTEPKVKVTYYVKNKNNLNQTYSICDSIEEAIDKRQIAGVSSTCIVRETITTQIVMSD